REVTREYLHWLVACLEDPQKLDDFLNTPEACAGVEAHIMVIEHGVQLLITERARQIAGLPFIYTARLKPPVLHRAKPPRQILARLSRAAALFHDLERLAQRRAKRMQRERIESPLRLAPSAQSTSPALRAEEENHRRLSSSSATRWGRWIARTCAQDGGGHFAQPRGPPPKPHCLFPIAYCLGSTASETAPPCPFTKNPPQTRSIP
ncbi:MAG: hypothetical protein Q8R82_03895, partial [Hyphomonadaceae bacterium]|nr:hypothetical protein [Hyphomonadaceae bacterium]